MIAPAAFEFCSTGIIVKLVYLLSFNVVGYFDMLIWLLSRVPVLETSSSRVFRVTSISYNFASEICLAQNTEYIQGRDEIRGVYLPS